MTWCEAFKKIPKIAINLRLGELDALKVLSHWPYRKGGWQGDTNMGGKVLNMEKGY